MTLLLHTCQQVSPKGHLVCKVGEHASVTEQLGGAVKGSVSLQTRSEH